MDWTGRETDGQIKGEWRVTVRLVIRRWQCISSHKMYPDCGGEGMAWQKAGIRREKCARKGGFKTDETQRQDEERQSKLNKLSRNWNWRTIGLEKSKPDFVRERRRVWERKKRKGGKTPRCDNRAGKKKKRIEVWEWKRKKGGWIWKQVRW